MARIRRHLPAVALVAAMVALALWPVFPAGEALGHRYGDLSDHYWGTWWFGGELLQGRLPLTTDVSHVPDHLRLWHIDPLGAILALPLRALGFPAAWNALLLVQMLFAALAIYAMVVDLLRSRSAAVVAAATVAASPYLLGLVHSGLSEYLGLGFPVLYVWALIRAAGLDPRGRPPPRRGTLVAAVLLAVSTLQAFYYGAFGLVLALCFVAGEGWRGRLRPLATTVGLYAVLVTPLLVVAAMTLVGDEAAIGAETAPGWSFAGLPATDLLTFIAPGAYYFPDTVAEGNPGILHVNYLGWSVLALALVGLARERRLRSLRAPAAAYTVAALGPRLAYGKQILSLGPVPLVLPLALLYVPFSPFRMVHHPYRLVALSLPLLALFVAAGALRLRPGHRPLAAAVILTELLLMSPVPWPVATAPVEPPAVLERLDAGAVLDWPPDASEANRDYLRWQVAHGRPVPYGVNVFLGETMRRDPLVAELLGALDDVEDRAANRDQAFGGDLALEPDPGPTRLGDWGFRYLILHQADLTVAERTATWAVLRERLGDPVEGVGDDVAWEIPGTCR